jgi:thiamine biosynthesis lipoprotein
LVNKYSFSALGTRCVAEIHASDDVAGATAVAMVLAEVERIEKKYSRYIAESFLSEINRAALTAGSVEVDEETADLLDYAATCHAVSGGLFDITAGLLRRAWNFSSGRLPEPDAVAALVSRIGWDRVGWDRPLLRFTVPDMEIDFGGIGKEYAVDRVANLLLEAGFEHGLIDLGGDMGVLGPRQDGSPWRIGLRHSRRPDEVAAEVCISRGSIATSGDYERCVEVGGRRYSHLLDPRTGWPVTGLASVTVLAGSCMVAGSLATIALLKGEEGIPWLSGLAVPHWWTTTVGRAAGNLPALVDLPPKRDIT